MKLDFARRCADRILERLGPFADRIEVAGSIRRRRPEVGDVDLVAIPKLAVSRDLLGAETVSGNFLAEEVQAWCAKSAWKFRTAGAEYMSWTAGEAQIQVDLWMTTEAAFGSVLLCRTGSAAHNTWLATRALEMNAKWHPHRGLYHGLRCIGKTEEEIYTTLGLPFLDPVTDRDAPAFLRFRR